MIIKTKQYSIQLILLLFTIYTQAQTPVSIIKGSINTPYIVRGSESLIATQSITLSPNTIIQSGSTFLARISPDEYSPVALSNGNFVFTRKYQKALKVTEDIANNADVLESVIYHDGLGRPIQNIAIKASPNKTDIISHTNYDNIGRQEKEYLAYPDNSIAIGSYRNELTAINGINDYYKTNYPDDINNAAPNPYSQKKFDNSPLSRVLLQASPGKDWAIGSGHEIKLDYQTNTVTATDEVKLYIVTTQLNSEGVYIPTLTLTTNYSDNQLYKIITKDENWTSGKNNTVEEFKNKEGQVILKRTYSNYGSQTEVRHDTYYIYDVYGNLTYVLPPKAEGSINDLTLKELGYQYRYDNKNRLVEKKLPGKEWEYIVYDKLDRPVLTQDANLKSLNKWLFTKYDAFSRPIYTGEYINTLQTTRALVQTEANKSISLFENKQITSINIKGTSINYSNNAFPNTDIDLFTINYYDDYLNINLDGGTSVVSYGITPITNAIGLSTCSKIRILDTTDWITSVTYFDNKSRPIYNYSKNLYLSTINTSKSKLDFAGKILETTNVHQRENYTTITTINTFTYDHNGRVLTQKQKINNQAEELIFSYNYGNLGQLLSKGVGGKTTQSRLQNIDFNYSIRGWLNKINDINNIGNDLFTFKINYNNETDITKSLYNGNISQTFWKTANSDTSLRNYTYTYDNLNRLTRAVDNINRYNEDITYDKNGNILTLARLGNTDKDATQFGVMDNLVYSYDNGNKLQKVEDLEPSAEGFNNGSSIATEYTYDNNGNLKTDENKKIRDIKYNHLNLPTLITLTRNGTASIHYVYDALGTKLQKSVTTKFQVIDTDYAEGYIYENSTLKLFSQPEGYISNTNGIFNYIYQYKDHLGNNRLSYQDKDNNGIVNNSEIVQENNYYPFGLSHKGYNTAVNGEDNKYKYNGKELQDELSLNLYDYGARNYDPALGRWMNIDPLAETSRRFSPFTYALNNPVYFIDPDGMAAMSPIYGSQGQFLGTDNQGYTGDAIFMQEGTFATLGGQGMDHNLALQVGSTLNDVIGDNPSETFTQEEIDMVNNAITDMVSRTSGYESAFSAGIGTPFSNDLHNGKTSSSYYSPGNSNSSPKIPMVWKESNNGNNLGGNYPVVATTDTSTDIGKALITYNLQEYSGFGLTVENVQNTWVHEFGNHFKKGVPGTAGEAHAKAYTNQSSHPSWKGTSENFKKNMRNNYKDYTGRDLNR